MSRMWQIFHYGYDETLMDMEQIRNKMLGIPRNGKVYEQRSFPGSIGRRMQDEYKLRTEIFVKLLERRCKTDFELKHINDERNPQDGWLERYRAEGNGHALVVVKGYQYDSQYGTMLLDSTEFILDGESLGTIELRSS